jgi:predicted RNase H-like HicB family nuclease
MKRIQAIIEKNPDGGYSIYCINEPFSGMGDTPEAAKEDMIGSMALFAETAKQNNYPYPAWMDDEYEIDGKYDVESLLTYYSKIITPTALSRLTGINAKQIRSYSHGKSKPRVKQLQKIQQGLRDLASELSTVSLL